MMKRTVPCKPYFYGRPPSKKINIRLDSIEVGACSELDIKTYWIEPYDVGNPNPSVYNEKVEPHFVPVQVKKIIFDYADDDKLECNLYGDEIDDPDYEKKLQRYETDKKKYEEQLKIWEQEEAIEQEERMFENKKREYEIYLKLKKIYEENKMECQ